MNSWTGVGRLVKDCELRKTPSGTPVCTFTIAVRKDEKVKDGEKDAWFFNCVAWNKKAEYISMYGKKGATVAVEGALRQKEYETKNGKVRDVECVCDRLDIVARPQTETQAEKPAEPVFNVGNTNIPIDDDALPF